MKFPILVVGVTVLLGACAFQAKVRRAPGAPILSPSSSAQVVATAPVGATALGTISVQGNNWQNGSGCEAQALFEAKKIGATHVVIRPANSSLGRGVKCTADAFVLQAK